MKKSIVWIGLMLGLLALPMYAQSPLQGNASLKIDYLHRGRGTNKLYNNTLYVVNEDYRINQSAQPLAGLEVESGATVVLFIRQGVTVELFGGAGYAGIRVPQDAKLVIAGEENSKLICYGGNASDGDQGQNGGDAYVNATAGKTCYAGYGGAGGNGGHGAGAGIGGNGGAGGAGAPQTKRVETVHYKSLGGHDGVDGLKGENGEPMGEVYISGDVCVTARGGQALFFNSQQAGRGRNDESGYWVPFCRHKMNAGGGGGGGNGGHGGASRVRIGGGAPGGGGGGAGGSGATDAYEGGQAGKGLGAKGEGGWGGEGNSRCGMHGYDFGCQATFHDPNLLSGSGGRGGSMGSYGANGLLLAQKAQNFDTGDGYTWVSMVAAKYPLDLTVTFAQDKVSSLRPNDYKFYYGMVPLQTITVPYSPDTTYKFGGYYLSDSTMIYNAQGQLTEAGKKLCYRFDNVTLYPYWIGPSSVRLNLKYEKSDVLAGESPWQIYPYFAYYFILPEHSKHITWCAKDYLPEEGYSTDTTKCMDIELQPSTQYVDSFIYTLHRHEMNWSIPQGLDGAYDNLYMKNDQGQKVKQLTQVFKYHQTVTAPTIYFEHPQDSLAIQLVGWSNCPTIMPDSDITTNHLIVNRIVLPVYSSKSDSGRVMVCNQIGDSVGSCYYGDTLTIRLMPNTGCHALEPKVHTFVQAVLGETLPVTKIDDNTYRFCCTNEVMIIPIFAATEYAMNVTYVYDSVPGGDAKPYTYAQSKNAPEAVLATDLRYHYGDVISFAGWLDTDTLESWIMAPVCTTAKGDTVDLQMNFTEKIKDRRGKQVTMPCYSFTAPDGNIHLKQKVYYLPRTQCKVYNLTEYSEIDSVLVNYNSVELSSDSIAMVRTLDVVSLQVADADTSVARAGYWDESQQYHPLPMSIRSIEVGGGDFATLFSTLAPNRPMSIGLIDGLKIVLEHCDSVVQWHAPSAASEGDTVMFSIENKNPREIVVIDSVMMYDVNSTLLYRFAGDSAKDNQFVMPNTSLFVYVYAHVADSYHTVTFVNIDGDILQHSDYHLTGDTITYNGDTPSYESDTTYLRYEFIGWTPAIHPVVGNDVYTATYKRYITIDENADNDAIIAQYDGQLVNIDLLRSMNPQYYVAVAFPFTLTMPQVSKLFGEETVVGKFSSMSNENNTLTFRFAGLRDNDTLNAGYPYLLRPGQLVMQTTIDSVVMTNRLDTVKKEWAEFTPIFSPYWMNDRDYSLLFFSQNRLCYPANPSGPFRGIRAYFKLTNGADGRMRTVAAQENANANVDYVDGAAMSDPAVDEVMEMNMMYMPFDPMDDPTSIEWVTPSTNEQAVKMIHNGIFYIRINDTLLNAQGQRIQ